MTMTTATKKMGLTEREKTILKRINRWLRSTGFGQEEPVWTIYYSSLYRQPGEGRYHVSFREAVSDCGMIARRFGTTKQCVISMAAKISYNEINAK